MADIPTVPPTTITAGNSIAWTITLDDYPADDSWVLSYVLLNSTTKITITSSADGADHAVSVAAVTTASYTVGEYQFAAFVTDGTDRYTVDEGIIEILADYEIVTTLDTRSHVKKVLDALESLMEGKAAKDVVAYSIHGRSLTSMSIEEVRSWYDDYSARYRREQIKLGNIKRKIIKSRFANV